jgi:hypothetical protein
MSTVLASVLGSVLTALVAVIGIFVTRTQAARSDRRLALETTVSGLKLLATSDGTEYAPRALVAGGLATLIHLRQPVVAMRALAPSWDESKIDVRSAVWLISEVFTSSNAQAQMEAAAVLDAHATKLCGSKPGQFWWPASVEFRWLPGAPLPARLRLMHAVLGTLLSKPADWWQTGGRLGWAVEVIHQAMDSDEDWDLRSFAADALDVLVPFVEVARLVDIQSAQGWVSVTEIRAALKVFKSERDATVASGRRIRTIVMLRPSLAELRAWVSGGVTFPG